MPWSGLAVHQIVSAVLQIVSAALFQTTFFLVSCCHANCKASIMMILLSALQCALHVHQSGHTDHLYLI
jgi:hypothetical protein